MKNYNHGLLISLLCQTVFLIGCTGMLWEKERFAKCHWAANPPGLRMHYSESDRDVLAEYNEMSEGTTAIQRRAYWVRQNNKEVLADRRPEFVSVTNAQNLVAVPVVNVSSSLPDSFDPGPYAVVATNGESFTLYLGEKDPRVYRLPVYYVGSGQRVKQVLLTPFAVATDATVVGGIIAMVIAYIGYEVGAEGLYANTQR